MTTDDEQLLREMWCAYTLHATPMPFDVKEAMRAVLAVVRERDGRDAERWRHWRLHAHEFGVMLPFAGPADMDSAIDAAIDAAMRGEK